jgi:hypothetical protein
MSEPPSFPTLRHEERRGSDRLDGLRPQKPHHGHCGRLGDSCHLSLLQRATVAVRVRLNATLALKGPAMSPSLPTSPALISSQASLLPSFDLYGAAHRGLRWAHSNLMLRLGSTSPGDVTQTESALAELGSLLDLCSVHLNLEDRHYHPALERRRSGSSAATTEAHEQHYRALAALRGLLATVGTDPARWRGLYLAYASFVAEDLLHMGEEETMVQPLFEELYSAAELRKLNDDLVADISPADKVAFLRVMLPAANREGRIALLGPVKAALPPGAFQGLLAALRPTLSKADFDDLVARLSLPRGSAGLTPPGAA